MVRIEDSIVVDAPIETVFNAERNISLHSSTQQHRSEKAIGGVTEGLIENGQEVEWEANHFGIKQRLRVRITHMKKPRYFRDEMIKGIFKSFVHEHIFTEVSSGKTEKKDVILLEAPFGLFGKIAERLFLQNYMRTFIRKKNKDLKQIIETSNVWNKS